MCQWGTCVMVYVKVPADLSATGRDEWRLKAIDACIADIVAALQAAGIDMRSSCCGHGKELGHIELQDGRMLIIGRPDRDKGGDMLTVTFHNDGTGNEAIGNYDVTVAVNDAIIYTCRIEGHERRRGWTELVDRLVFAAYREEMEAADGDQT